MNLDIQQLKITISTNIPEIKSIEFTSNLLYNPEFKTIRAPNKYPYITSVRDYPVTVLKGMSYDNMIDFFFNKKTFTRILNSSEYPPVATNKDLDPNNIYKKNVMTTLELIFSTKYFVVNNVHQSLDIVLDQPSSKSIFYNPLTTQFSYLKIFNKPYTVTKTVWLNDIVNHPKYQELIKEVHNVKKSLKDEEIEFKLAENKGEPTSSNKNDELNYFKKYIQPKFSTSIRKSQDYYTQLFRKSSNELLQRYIDGKNPEDTKKLFESFEQIFNQFFMNNKSAKVDDNQLLDIGVDKINFYKKERREKDYPENEIFVLLSLIDGEVNESNKKDVYCPYTDQYLGNMLDNLLHTSSDENNYIIEPDELVYSIKSESIKQTDSEKQQMNIKEVPNVNPVKANVLNEKVNKINDIFFGKIFNTNDDKKLNAILTEITELTGKYVNQDNILKFIENTYKDKDTFNMNPNYNLNNLILKWNNDMIYKNKMSKGVEEELNKMNNTLTYDMKQINKRIDEIDSSKVEEFNALKNKLSVINLYLYIINRLIEKPENQPAMNNGGKKVDNKNKYKRRNKTIKKRRPNRKRTYKK